MLQYLFTHTPLAFFTQSLWRDEAFSYFLAKKNLLEIIILSAQDFSPPLYHLILHFWLKFFGPSEVSLRSLSLIFFWTTLYVCFLFLKEILKLSTQKSLLYLLLFLLNPILTFYAFEARMYSMLMFFATLSYYSYLKKNSKIYLISTVLGLYTHYFMFFVVGTQILFNYLTNKGRRLNVINKLIFNSFLFTLPWLLTVALLKKFQSSFWIDKTETKTFVNLLGIIYTGFERNLFWISVLLFSVFIITLVKIIRNSKTENFNLYLILSLWGIGIPFFVALISLIKPIFFPRYFIFSSVGLILLIIFCLEHLKIKARFLILIGLLILTLHYQKLQINTKKRTDFKKIAEEIKIQTKKSDYIYVTNELDFFTAKYYFQNNRVLIYNKTYEEIPDFVGKVLIKKEDLAKGLPSYPKKAFLLTSNGTYTVQALY